MTQLENSPKQFTPEIQHARDQLLKIGDFSQIGTAVLRMIEDEDINNDERTMIVNSIVDTINGFKDNVSVLDALPIINSEALFFNAPPKPPEIIENVLFKGCKMSFNAPSKFGKTWSLLHLGLSIAGGKDWLGLKTTKSKVLLINPELINYSFGNRVHSLAKVILDGPEDMQNFKFISLRGEGFNSDTLIEKLNLQLKEGDYDVLILDSIYKLFPKNCEENSNSDIGRFLTSLESLTKKLGCALIYSHHYSKGNQAGKASIDRSSGAGAFGRDPDTIVSITEHQQDNAYVVDFNLRDFKKLDPFCVRVNWPSITVDKTLDTDKLNDGTFTQEYTTLDITKHMFDGDKTTTEIKKLVSEETGMSKNTFYRLWDEVKSMSQVTQLDKKWKFTTPGNPNLK